MYNNQGKLIIKILLQAKNDYLRSRSILRDVDIECYLESEDFQTHCEILQSCLGDHKEMGDPRFIKDWILDRKHVNKEPRYINIEYAAFVLDFNYDVAYNICKSNGWICYPGKPDVAYIKTYRFKELLKSLER